MDPEAIQVVGGIFVYFAGIVGLALLLELVKAAIWGAVFLFVLRRVFGRNTCER